MRARFTVYALLACVASALQFGFYDCSGLPALSFGAGALTVFTALVTIDHIYWVSVSARPFTQRVAIGLALGVAGAAAVSALGWFTLITHMCG